MPANTESLKDIYLNIAETKTIIERQEAEHSRDTISESEADLEQTVWAAMLEDGLDDAVDGMDLDAAGVP